MKSLHFLLQSTSIPYFLGSWRHKGAGCFWAKTSIWDWGYQACNTLVLNVMEKEYFQHITGSCHNDEQSIWAGIEVLFGILAFGNLLRRLYKGGLGCHDPVNWWWTGPSRIPVKGKDLEPVEPNMHIFSNWILALIVVIIGRIGPVRLALNAHPMKSQLEAHTIAYLADNHFWFVYRVYRILKEGEMSCK